MAKAFSIEDGNLGTASIVTARTQLFKDIDLSFTARPSGDIYKKVDAAAVKQSIKNLLLTNRLERPFQPTFGCNLRGLLFELADDVTAYLTRENIIKQITAYEPRARIITLRVTPQPDNNAINVYIEAQIKNANNTLVVIDTQVTEYR